MIGDTAQTGIKYDGKGKEVTDRQYLAFRFSEVSDVDVIGDELDPDSIDIGDFYVEGFSILSYIHPSDERARTSTVKINLRPALQGVRQTGSRVGERREA